MEEAEYYECGVAAETVLNKFLSGRIPTDSEFAQLYETRQSTLKDICMVEKFMRSEYDAARLNPNEATSCQKAVTQCLLTSRTHNGMRVSNISNLSQLGTAIANQRSKYSGSDMLANQPVFRVDSAVLDVLSSHEANEKRAMSISSLRKHQRETSGAVDDAVLSGQHLTPGEKVLIAHIEERKTGDVKHKPSVISLMAETDILNVPTTDFGNLAFPAKHMQKEQNTETDIIQKIIDMSDGTEIVPPLQLRPDGTVDASSFFDGMPFIPAHHPPVSSDSTRPSVTHVPVVTHMHTTTSSIDTSDIDVISLDLDVLEPLYDDIASAEPAETKNDMVQYIANLQNVIAFAIMENESHRLSTDLMTHLMSSVGKSESVRSMFNDKISITRIVTTLTTLIFDKLGIDNDTFTRNQRSIELEEYIRQRRQQTSTAEAQVETRRQAMLTLAVSLQKDIDTATLHGVEKRVVDNVETDALRFNPLRDTRREIAQMISRTDVGVGGSMGPAFVHLSVRAGHGAERYVVRSFNDASVCFAVSQKELNAFSATEDAMSVFYTHEGTASYVAEYLPSMPVISIEHFQQMMIRPLQEDIYSTLCANGNQCIGKTNTMCSNHDKFILPAFILPNEDWETELRDIVFRETELRTLEHRSSISDEQLRHMSLLLESFDTSSRQTHPHMSLLLGPQGAAPVADADIMKKMRDNVLKYKKRKCILCISHDYTTKFFSYEEFDKPIHSFVFPAGEGGLRPEVCLLPTNTDAYFRGIVGVVWGYNENLLFLTTWRNPVTDVMHLCYMLKDKNFH